MKFRKFGDRQRVLSGVGERYHATRIPVYDKSGKWHLEYDGKKVDIVEDIQSYRDSVDINVLIARFQAGDEAALSRVQGFYADVHDLPKTYTDWLNLRISAEQEFMALKPEIRAKFENSLDQFLSGAGSEEWFNKLGIDMKPAGDQSADVSPTDTIEKE